MSRLQIRRANTLAPTDIPLEGEPLWDDIDRKLGFYNFKTNSINWFRIPATGEEESYIPAHEWNGTSLRFQLASGDFGPWVDLAVLIENITASTRLPDGSFDLLFTTSDGSTVTVRTPILTGLSAYESAQNSGFEGTEAEWIDSLNGDTGYEVAVRNGYEGTELQWLASLHGDDGYQIAINEGLFVGTRAQWLASLKGNDAYAVAQEAGFTGTREEWLLTLKGDSGDGNVSSDDDITEVNELLMWSTVDGRRVVGSGKKIQDIADKVHTHVPADISGLDATLTSYGSRLDGVDNSLSQHTTAINAKQNSTEKNVANGYAGLDATGKVMLSLLPSIAITDTFEAANETAMLALGVQKGDICIRSDISKTFICVDQPANIIGNWKEMKSPTDLVLSVAGKIGAVTLVTADITDAKNITKTASATDLEVGNVPRARQSPGLQANPTSVTDWNNALDDGWYMGSSVANAPTADWYKGEVISHNSLYTIQTVTQFTTTAAADTKTWRRAKINGVWQAWYRVLVSRDEMDTRYVETVNNSQWVQGSNLSVGPVSAGYSQLNGGDTTLPGYVSFHKTNGTRMGYVGWGSGNRLVYQAENGYAGHTFNGDMVVAGVIYAGGGSNGRLLTDGNLYGTAYGTDYLTNWVEGRCAAHQNAAVNRSVSSLRMAGYTEALVGNATNAGGWTNSAYVFTYARKVDSDTYVYGARQPQAFIANIGWFAAFPF